MSDLLELFALLGCELNAPLFLGHGPSLAIRSMISPQMRRGGARTYFGSLSRELSEGMPLIFLRGNERHG